MFREDDRVTKAILEFVEPIAKGPEAAAALVQALFFARWCNRDTTLRALRAEALSDPLALRQQLLACSGSASGGASFPPPWCNETAYPVEAVTWEGVRYSRLDAATILFHKISPWLLQSIRST